MACNMALIVANELISTSTLLLILFKKISLSLSLTLYTVCNIAIREFSLFRVWCRAECMNDYFDCCQYADITGDTAFTTHFIEKKKISTLSLSLYTVWGHAIL